MSQRSSCKPAPDRTTPIPPFTVAASSGTTTVTFNNMNGVTGSGLPANTDKVRVQRVTPSASLLTTFQNASLLRADDLNDNAKQLLFVLQEQVDAGVGSLPLNAAGFYDANSRRISNLADGVAEQDAATFSQLSALASYNSEVPTVPQFATFSGANGNFDGTDTTFTIPFTPLSEIDATFICEVGGVVQVPGSDFGISGNILTIINRNVTNSGANAENIAKIVIQAFGVTKSVFDFPTTGNAANSSETPITLKGAASGDGTAMLSVKDSGNVENASITAGGNVKAKVVEPNAGGTLAVNPSTITTTGTINSGGDLTVGSASITKATGDATVNNLTINSSTQNANQAVPKSYVDANGGFEGSTIGSDTNLNTILTPGLYTGTVPANPSTLTYPGNSSEGEKFALRVVRTGGATSPTRFQEFLSSSDNRITVRKYNGSSFSGWRQTSHTGDAVSSMGAATESLNLGNQRIINLADNTAAQDAVTQNHLQTNYKTNSEIIDHVGKYFGPFSARALYKVCDNVDPKSNDPRLFQMDGGTSPTLTNVLDPYSITSGITMVPISGQSSDPETYNNGPGTGGQNDIENPFLLKITAGLGPVQLLLFARPSTTSSNFNFRLNQYTAQTALTAQKFPMGSVYYPANFSSPLNRKYYIPNLTATRYFGVEGYVSANSGTDEDIASGNFYLITRPSADFSNINYFATQA